MYSRAQTCISIARVLHRRTVAITITTAMHAWVYKTATVAQEEAPGWRINTPAWPESRPIYEQLWNIDKEKS